jgi:Ankyrin repeat
MAKSRKPKVSLADRRGVFPDDGCGNDWEMTLIQIPGRTGPVDLDELLDRLIERGVVGTVRRDIAADLHAGRIPTPAGAWALLVSLPGQSWAYLLPGHRSDELAAEVAARAGLRVIHAGYSDFANATAFRCVEREQTLVRFETCDMGSEVVEAYSGDFDEAISQTLFAGTRFPREWLERFEDEWKVIDALAKEFDAFIPCMGASGFGDSIGIGGFDREEFKPGDYLRIDLIGFGEARLEPSAADLQLRDAITAGDVEAIRSAVAAGADLRTVPVLNVSPLQLALSPRSRGESRRPLVAALLELGADPNDPGGEPAIHALLDAIVADEAELIDLLELLTSHGADVNARGKELLSRTRSPLHVAAQKGWLAVAKFLISNGADARATDALGHTPRQAAEAAAASIQSFGAADADARYAPILAFLADAEAGRADLDWHKDAEEASRRERHRRREMQRAFAQIGTAFKALGQVMGDDPSDQAIADAVTLTQPEEIHLTPGDAGWPSEAARAETAALLAAEGFEPIGRFAIPEMPRIRLEAYHHPGEHLDAAIYDAAGQSILDFVRYGQDGTRLTVTNNTTRPETHFDMPEQRTIRLPGASPAELLEAIRAEPAPPGGVAPVPAGGFVERFEGAYRREIKARKRQLRRQ